MEVVHVLRLFGLIGSAVGFLMGLQAVRTFATSLVWMAGRSITSNTLMMLGGALVVTLLMIYVALNGRTDRALWERLAGAVLTALYVIAIVWPAPQVRLVASGLASLSFLFWLAAYVHGHGSLLGTVIVALSLDVASRSLLHGLDLPFANQPWLACALGAVFLASLVRPAAPGSGVGWPLLALGPWLFVQLEYLTHPARVAAATGLPTSAVAGLIQAGLACATLGALLGGHRRWRLGLGLLGAAALIWQLHPVTMLVGQAGLGALIAPAFRPGRSRVSAPIAICLSLGMSLLYYGLNTWPPLTPAAIGLAAAIGLVLPQATVQQSSLRPILVPLLISALMMLPTAIARPSADVGQPQETLTAMTWNIHHGMDDISMPAIGRIADLLIDVQPDIAGFQEVTRGWTVTGASDLVQYLSHRLPQYRPVFGPVAGDLWGTLILTRHPILDSGYERFGGTALQLVHGFSWALVRTPHCDTLVVNVHFTAGSRGGVSRDAQMQQVLDFWGGRPCTIFLGDANSHPAGPPMPNLWAAGFTDWMTAVNGSHPPSFPAAAPRLSIDYVATTREWIADSAHTLAVRHSDHRPVVTVLRPSPERP